MHLHTKRVPPPSVTVWLTNFNPELLNVLIKFRLHNVAFTADIAKAFLQIGLKKRYTDVRFLWTYCMIPRCRILKGSFASWEWKELCLEWDLALFCWQWQSEPISNSIWVWTAKNCGGTLGVTICGWPHCELAWCGWSLFYHSTNKGNLASCRNGPTEMDLRVWWMKDQIECTADSETALHWKCWDWYGGKTMMTLCSTYGKCLMFWRVKRILRGVSFKSCIFDPIGFLTPQYYTGKLSLSGNVGARS